MNINIQDVQRGDVVRFAAYALRVEFEPVKAPNSVTLRGRISVDGCPLVTRRFIGPRVVTVERAT